MKFNKGQALLEFVLILPIFLLFLLSMIDFGRIIFEKNRLESIVGDAVDLIKKGTYSDDQIEDILESDYKIPLTLIIEHNEENIIVNLNRKLDVITPGLGIAIEDPYTVETSRVIKNE